MQGFGMESVFSLTLHSINTFQIRTCCPNQLVSCPVFIICKPGRELDALDK